MPKNSENSFLKKYKSNIVTGITTGVVAAVVIVITMFSFSAISNASSTAEPGSSSDPVVTKSYVDQRIDDVMGVLNYSAGASTNTGTVNSQSSSANFSPVSVNLGNSIIGGEGCEMILRSGRGFAVAATDGISNVTTGKDIKNNGEIPANNLLIIPRNDGRGVRVVESAWFLVKGSYCIK